MVCDTRVENPFFKENAFRTMAVEAHALPTFATARPRLPVPHWPGHDEAIACYWRAWELAFGNLRTPTAESGFVRNFIDTAFNKNLFMWDSAFILMFGRYGARAFDFQATLENFYAKQHKDGYICREIREVNGEERFERHDPSSTGPNVLPWCEWEYFCNTGDRARLARVFPVLVAYTQWMRKFRTWPDGTHWSSGWGCGMDNQPRLPPGCKEEFDHGHMSWIDTTCQQVLADRILLRMATVLGRASEIDDVAAEARDLTRFVNRRMWNGSLAFYTDRYRDGSLSTVKSIASFWALLAGMVPPKRLPSFLAHLENEKEFNRPHRVPSLSADHPAYHPDGDYWCGAVWAPTNYMVLRGLTQAGRHDLAHAIAVNHVQHVAAVHRQTGTLFENYAPESTKGMFRKEFVGWTGVPPITVLFEYVFGLRPDVPKRTLLWDVRLLDEHGVANYPYGADGCLNLHCEKRARAVDEPVIRATGNCPVRLRVVWSGGTKTVRVTQA
jgi:glycogen debranching enzyme